MYRAAYFAKINLSTAGLYRYEISSFSDGDVSAFGRQFRFAANSRRANVPAAGVQIGFAMNVSGVDVAACGKRDQIARGAFHLNMATFGF